jgi:hypothetical protein
MSEKAIIESTVKIPFSLLSINDIQEIKKCLTLEKKKSATFGFPSKDDADSVFFYSLDKDHVYVPRKFGINLIRQRGFPFEDRRTDGEGTDLIFNEVAQSARPDLKPRQDIVVNETLEGLSDLSGTNSGLLQAGTGSGKTILAIKIICKLGRKALIVVNSDFLSDQWQKQLLNFTSIKKDEIGIIKQDLREIENKKVVIGLIQTLVRREFSILEKDVFGTVVWDECLTGDSPVLTRDGYKKIQEIVDNHIKVSVLSHSKKSHTFEWKPIVGWFNQGRKRVVRVWIGKTKYIDCTANHKFLVLREKRLVWIEARNLKAGDRLKGIKEKKILCKCGCGKASLCKYFCGHGGRTASCHQKTSLFIEKFLYGTLLGDSCLSYPHKTSSYPRFQCNHGICQKRYASHKANLLKNFGSRFNVCKNGGFGDFTASVSTACLPCFDRIYKIVYTKHKKKLSFDWLNKIGRIGLAYWIMDDGSISKNMIRLHTESFSKKEVKLICKWFGLKFKIFPSIYSYRSYDIVGFSTKDSKKLARMISKYIIPSMRYKLPSIY